MKCQFFTRMLIGLLLLLGMSSATFGEDSSLAALGSDGTNAFIAMGASFEDPTKIDAPVPAASPLPTTAITTTAATINWTSVPCAVLYEYRIRYTISTGVFSAYSSWINVGLSTSVMLTGLTPNTTYQFQVREKCTIYAAAATSTQFTTCNNFTFYADNDNDGFGNAASSIIVGCNSTPPSGYVSNSTDCNDGNASIKPGAVEICNGIDDDCNGTIDTLLTYYADADADTYGNPATGGIYCKGTQPSGYVTNNTDCDDTRNFVRPGATELCNGLDDNCDGTVDNVTTCPSPTPGSTVAGVTTATLNWPAIPCATLGYE